MLFGDCVRADSFILAPFNNSKTIYCIIPMSDLYGTLVCSDHTPEAHGRSEMNYVGDSLVLITNYVW